MRVARDMWHGMTFTKQEEIHCKSFQVGFLQGIYTARELLKECGITVSEEFLKNNLTKTDIK